MALTKRALLAATLARRVGRRPGAGLARQADPPDRAAGAGRHRRHRRAHVRRRTRQVARPDRRGRQQDRRRRHHRHRRSGARAAPTATRWRWSRRARMVFNIGLYKAPGYDSLKDLTLVAVTRRRVQCPDRPSRQSGQDGGRDARPGARQAGRAHLFVGRRRHQPSHVGRAARAAHRREAAARALSRHAGRHPGGGQRRGAMGLFNTPTVIGPIKAGKLKALAVTSEQRSELLPEVPTMIEAGVKDYVVEYLDGLRRARGRARAGGVQAQCRAEPHRPIAAGAREDAGPGHRNAAAGVAGRGAKAASGTTWRCGCPSSRRRGRRRSSPSVSLQNSALGAYLPASPKQGESAPSANSHGLQSRRRRRDRQCRSRNVADPGRAELPGR